MTRDEALAKAATQWWETASDHEIVRFQLYEPLLCMPFGRYHEAVEAVLGRPVFTHEFVKPEALRDELEGRREPLDPLDSLRQLVLEEKIVVIDPGADHPRSAPADEAGS